MDLSFVCSVMDGRVIWGSKQVESIGISVDVVVRNWGERGLIEPLCNMARGTMLRCATIVSIGQQERKVTIRFDGWKRRQGLVMARLLL